MNFVKHTWVTGERVTAALLNRIENALEELFNSNQTFATDADCDSLFDHFLEDDD